MIRILFTGGGSGGHIYPIIAVAEALKNVEVRYLGACGDLCGAVEEQGIKVSKIFGGKFRRYFDLRNLFDILILLPLSFLRCLWKIFWFMPDVLFSKGGPGALAVVLASRFYRIPVIVHESDTIPGLTNKISVLFAQKTLISFESTKAYFKTAILVGNPVRPSLLSQNIDALTAKKLLGFDPAKPLLAVVGGSQGSQKINDFIIDSVSELLKNFQIIHQTGKKNFEELKKEFELVTPSLSEDQKNKYRAVPYFEKDYKNVLIAADLIISRASSGTIFETAAFGKPAILIPLPSEVVGDHQVQNAYEYANSGAAIVIEELNLKSSIVLHELNQLFSDTEKLKQMSQAAKSFAKPEAAGLIAEEIIKNF